VTQVLIVWNPTSRGESLIFKEVEAVAKVLSIQLQSLTVRSAEDFQSGFQLAKKRGVQALVTASSPTINSNRAQILDFAANNRLPAIYSAPEFMDAGGLMSYGAYTPDLWRRAATYVDKILKGTHPADLPVEQPRKFELMINLKAAKQIGLTIPPNVLARADKVIR